MKPWKTISQIEDNPVALPKDAAARLLPQLDRHVASLFVLFHQYQKHHWLVEGPQYHDVHVFLGDAYAEVHKQVDALAERMTALGGIPTSSPVEQARLAYVEHEPEGAFRLRAMLELDRAHEARICQELRGTIRQAFELGDFGTETLLRGILVQCEQRAHHVDHYLGDDSLERQR